VRFGKDNKIKFFSIEKNITKDRYPKPAQECLPDWYKNQDSYTFGNKKHMGNELAAATIKKCIPIFDSLTSGYIIFSTVDIYVTQDNGQPYFHWSTSIEEAPAIEFHSNPQFSNHFMFKNLENIAKFNNPWIVETPKGYSSFITTPLHRDLPFELVPAIVDTDSYQGPLSFPFFLKNPKWEGLIASGTPIAQVVPFKREKWEMNLGSEKDIQKSNKDANIIRSNFFNGYKKYFWNKKSFK
jgi:hypothetical protein